MTIRWLRRTRQIMGNERQKLRRDGQKLAKVIGALTDPSWGSWERDYPREYAEPPVKTWCAGCGALCLRSLMGWTPEGLYHCRNCRVFGPAAVRKVRAEQADDQT